MPGAESSRTAPDIIGRRVFGGLFVAAGICHFCWTDLFARAVPPSLPDPRLLVQVSGAAEIGLGSLLQFRAGKRLAGWGLIALLLAVFPANVFMARQAARFPQAPAWLLWLRLPLQGALICWAWRYARPEARRPGASRNIPQRPAGG